MSYRDISTVGEASHMTEVEKILSLYIIRICREIYEPLPEVFKLSPYVDPRTNIGKIIKFFNDGGAPVDATRFFTTCILRRAADLMASDGHGEHVPELLKLVEVPEK